MKYEDTADRTSETEIPKSSAGAAGERRLQSWQGSKSCREALLALKEQCHRALGQHRMPLLLNSRLAVSGARPMTALECQRHLPSAVVAQPGDVLYRRSKFGRDS